jgi:phosphatidate cytidylyltransferase
VTAKRQSDLFSRAASALVLAPLVLVAVWIGGLAFAVMVAVVAGIVMLEWWTVTVPRRAGRKPELEIAPAVAAVSSGAAPLAMAASQPVAAAGLLIVGVVLVAVLHRGHSGGVAWPALGVLYAGIPAVALVALRDLPGGLWFVVLLFVVVWVTDSVAYFGGRAIGGRKLWPRVSPGKTWSGAICGLAGGVVAGVLIAVALGASPLAAAAVAAVLSIVSQLGDLGESAIKRRFGVKDTGKIIPGHGGVMDRVDGLLAAAVAAAALSLAIGTLPVFAGIG